MRRRVDLSDRVEQRLRTLERDAVVERIWRRDHTVWKPEPTEIADRLGWLDIDRPMMEQVDDLRRFAQQAVREGYTTAVLLGMGGSSLAPRVLASTLPRGTRGVELLVLDSTVPGEIRSVLQRVEAGRTLFIVSSKSGTTIETTSLLDFFWAREPEGRHYIAITDAGTPLNALAEERGFRRVFRNAADVGGRYSALSYVGLVPAALLDVDLDALLAGAAAMRKACEGIDMALNPGARLGAMLGEVALAGHDLLHLVEPEPDGISGEGIGAWIAQLLAESTGKEGTGILPFADETLRRSGAIKDGHVLGAAPGTGKLQELPGGDLAIATEAGSDAASLGGAFFCWEFATAVAGHVLAIHPFDQPDVEGAKRATTGILEGTAAPAGERTVTELLERIEPGQYLALHAYLPRTAALDERLRRLCVRLQERCGVPVMLEYGPALLHSTGQYHKGGGRRGAFIQLTVPDAEPLAIPWRAYNFDELKEAQAAGDRVALQARDSLVTRRTLDELEALW